jgi:hypothetical protein
MVRRPRIGDSPVRRNGGMLGETQLIAQLDAAEHTWCRPPLKLMNTSPPAVKKIKRLRKDDTVVIVPAMGSANFALPNQNQENHSWMPCATRLVI